jgi:hypothetical protein
MISYVVMRMRLLPGLVLFALACSSDDAATVAEASTDTSSTGDTTGVIEGSSSSEDGLSDTDAPVVEPYEYARGLRITRMTANQGVQVELVRDGIEIPAEEYETHLLAGRRTLLRGFWTLHVDFEPRELVGQLTIDYPDGSQLEQNFVTMVDGESSDGGASFQWLLEPEDIVDGMRFRVRILEPDPSVTQMEVSDPPPVLPLPGRGTMTFYEEPLELQVVLVPVLHQYEGCERVPDVTEQDVEDLRQALEQANPVQRAIFSVREPMPYTVSISEGPGFTPILVELSKTRTDDGVADNVYYYGLLDSCDGFPAGLGGQAFGIPDAPTPENAPQRVSTGRWYGSGAAAATVFVHEVGHSQGRRHVRCSGGEAGVDPAFPHPNGRIGTWGFGIHDFRLYTPTGSRDYMSYCFSNWWVSDYGWDFVLPIIETLTSWDHAHVEPPPRETVLYGVLHEDGSQDWWTTPGGVPTTTGEHTIAYEVEGTAVALPASVQTIPHGSAKLVIAPLPAPIGRLDSAVLRSDPMHAHPIDLSTVDRRR